MKTVEQRFGPREQPWTLLLHVAGQNFPQTIPIVERRLVLVRLTVSTQIFAEQRIYQLAHEVIHCISPRGRRDTIWFEEGFANHHALTLPLLPASYIAQAERLVPALFREPVCSFRALNASDQAILGMRMECPVLDDVTPELLKRHFGAGDALAHQLCQRLPFDRPPTM